MGEFGSVERTELEHLLIFVAVVLMKGLILDHCKLEGMW